MKFSAPHFSRPLSPGARRWTGDRRVRCAGFTIIEVAMATFVMALGIATSIVAMQAGFKHLDLARGTTLASQIIQSEMERIRLMSWSGVTALDGTANVDVSTTFSTSSKVAGKFTVTRTVTADGARPTEARKIVIAVTWNGYDGRAHNRSFESTYVKNGLYDYYYTIAHP
jgi:Tfp pilus assembly protein PilV